MENVLIVGQTPPPVNGQTVMIQGLLDGQYSGVRLHHVRMTFSRSIDEVGTFQIRKVWLLVNTLVQIIVGRLKSRATILYFPPAGPTLIPVLRDIVLLVGTRWMFRYTVFHFHAAGLTEIYDRLPRLIKPLYNLAYRKVDLAIFTAKSRSTAGYELDAKSVTAVPYGISDSAAGRSLDRVRAADHIPSILFMGILCEGKGLLTLIEACGILKKSGCSFRVVCGGTWDSETSPEEVDKLIESRGLKGLFSFPGVLWGEDKWNAFQNADIFCFPSHYYAESSPVVLTEAMCFQLPIVTTRWRGIPDVVGESGGAYLVEPKDPGQVADYLGKLLRDEDLRATMGKKNREWFYDNGTIERYRERMENALLSVKDPDNPAMATDCAAN
jgi:glycosyltransferase involved in cell wall biosynthesis